MQSMTRMKNDAESTAKNEEWCWKHCKEWHFDSSNIATDLQNQSKSQQLEQSLIGDQKRI